MIVPYETCIDGALAVPTVQTAQQPPPVAH
jgi:hypothetical protein